MRVVRLVGPLAWTVVLALALRPARGAAQGAASEGSTIAPARSSALPDSVPAARLIARDALPAHDRTIPLSAFEHEVAPTRADSVASAAARAAADADERFHLVISLAARELWAVSGLDTLYAAPVGVGMDARLEYDDRSWIFKTPRGERTVRAKATRPMWVPPDWHYAEVARAQQLRLAQLPADRPVPLADGRLLVIRDGAAGLLRPDSGFAPLPTDEEIVFDSTLFIPPIGTRNRQIAGELGAHQLLLGDGYLLHGTPHHDTIGAATTHGCIRLHDADIAWLYEHVPVGTKVYIY